MTLLERKGRWIARSFAFAASGVLAVACADTKKTPTPEQTELPQSQTRRADSPVLNYADSSLAIGSFMDSLRTLTGEFSSPDGAQWRFSGDQRLLADAAELDDAVVDSLVACLGDTSSSNATLAGRPVPRAIVCFEALRRITIVPGAEDSDTPWDGYLTPASGVDAIRKAHRAWSEVLRLKRYSRA